MYILRDMRVLDMYVSIMHQGVTVSHNIHPGFSLQDFDLSDCSKTVMTLTIFYRS